MIAKQSVLFGLLDSSPQGRNWLMVEYTAVEGDRLHEISVAVGEMAQLARGPEPQLMEMLRMSQHCHEVIGAALNRHVLPPTALGSRHGGADHKCHAWIHAHRLESVDWDMCQGLLDLYFTVAVDDGSESKVNTVDTTAET